MNTSILEILCWPLRLLLGYNVRQQATYEHVFTGIIVSFALTYLPRSWWLFGFGFLVGAHLVAKELIVDRIKHGEFNTRNIYERVYGLILGALVLWIR